MFESIYKKLLTMNIVRTRHVITFRAGLSAKEIKTELQRLPDGSTITEIDQDDDGSMAVTFKEETESTGEALMGRSEE